MKITIVSEAHRQRAISAIQSLPLEPVHVMEVREQKSKRSIQQNSIYWKWIDAIRLHVADSTGQMYSSDDLHEYLKAKFLPSTVVEIKGEPIRCRASTTKLSVKEMSCYLEAIDAYCVQSLGLYLPTNMEEL